MFPDLAAIANSLELRDDVIASLKNGLIVGEVTPVHKSSRLKRSIENHTISIYITCKLVSDFQTAFEFLDIQDEKIQVTIESP